jgi:hypothetical protein
VKTRSDRQALARPLASAIYRRERFRFRNSARNILTIARNHSNLDRVMGVGEFPANRTGTIQTVW